MANDPTPPVSQPTAAGKPGAPTDALLAFGAALASAAQAEAAASADPNVALSFSLGWQMAELYRPRNRRRYASHPAGGERDADLPGLGALDDPERAAILVDQVQAALARLAAPLGSAGFEAIDLAALRTPEAIPPQDAVLAVHVAILGHLTAADFRLGKAYGLGRALADTCRKPTDGQSVRRQLGRYRVANLLGWLDDLNSALPPHAGHAVAASLHAWSDWAAAWQPGTAGTGRAPLAEQDALRLLRRQGELWRALLSGEKRGADMLDMKDWLDVAEGFQRRLRTAAIGAIRRMPWLAGLIVVLFAAGVGLTALASSSGAIVAGAATVLTSIGLTWKGIGGSLGQLAGKLEQPLFGAATDAAVAAAVTLLSTDREGASARRRRLALELPASGRSADAAPDGH